MPSETSQDDPKSDDQTWSLPSSSVGDDSLANKTFVKKYRSKSAVSNDPRSPYYTSQGINEDSLKIGGRFTKAPSVSCVPGYDGHKYANVAKNTCFPLGYGIAGLNLSPDDPKAATIRQHYYPEGGWGYVICVCAVLVEILSGGLHYSFGLLIVIIIDKFGKEAALLHTVCIGALSMSFAMFLSPVIVALCRRKSTRLLAILGGLITALGCLFTSFATQLHQLFFSYGLFIGGGVGLTRGTAGILVGQYFKKKRELVESFVTSGTGIGMAVMPLLITQCVRTLGWRLGLQTITGMVTFTFILGIFYRPASLYHPQRRAILHLKGMQKRSKAKDKTAAAKDKPPFFDFSVLRSRTVQILISGSALSAFGVNVPVILLIYQGKKEGMDSVSLLLLQFFMGLSTSLGAAAFGFIVVKNSIQCLIARQYLNQASCFVMALSSLAFTVLNDYYGYLLFVWVYGFFYGGYQYSLKMFTFEKVRARNFSKAWGFLQCGQAIPQAVGFPLIGYLNEEIGGKKGFYFSSACLFIGGLFLFLIDIHKHNIKRQKANSKHERKCDRNNSPAHSNKDNPSRQSSFQEIPNVIQLTKQQRQELAKYAIELRRQELTCISEEVIIDNFLDDFVDDCITSCNKEEKYLMLSEFENNLNNTHESNSYQDVKKTPVRKKSVVTSPLIEQCPNCLRVVAVDGSTNCPENQSLAEVKDEPMLAHNFKALNNDDKITSL